MSDTLATSYSSSLYSMHTRHSGYYYIRIVSKVYVRVDEVDGLRLQLVGGVQVGQNKCVGGRLHR